jgi:threonine/homoserine/homoserine lactone efflux protein
MNFFIITAVGVVKMISPGPNFLLVVHSSFQHVKNKVKNHLGDMLGKLKSCTIKPFWVWSN